MRRIAWYRVAVPLAALLLAGPGLTGCSGLLSSLSSASSSASAAHGSAPAQPGGVRGQVADLQQGNNAPMAPPSGFNCPNQSLRGCFKESQMQTYFEYVLPFIDKFYDSTWNGLPLPKNVYFIPDGAKVREACEDQKGQPVTGADTSYNYCPADDDVYVGQQLAWLLYSEAGDVAPATGLAHEFGHNVQTQVGVPVPQTDAETLVHENQADCVSGAFLGWANDQRLLQQGDEPVLLRYLELISSSENDPNRTHGDFQERGGALRLGGEKGIATCNAYYPDNPIITSS